MSETDLMDIKQLVVIDILNLIAGGMKAKAACQEKGISYDTFNRYLAENREIKDAFIAGRRSQVLEQYSGLVARRANVIDKLMEAVDLKLQAESVSISDLVQIEKDLRAITSTVELQLGILQGADAIGASSDALIDAPTVTFHRAPHRITRQTVTLDFEKPSEPEQPVVIDLPSDGS